MWKLIDIIVPAVSVVIGVRIVSCAIPVTVHPLGGILRELVSVVVITVTVDVRINSVAFGVPVLVCRHGVRVHRVAPAGRLVGVTPAVVVRVLVQNVAIPVGVHV